MEVLKYLNKMKILFISEFFPPYTKGGAEISTYLIAKEISKNNIVYVLTNDFHKKNLKLSKINIYSKLKIFYLSKRILCNVLNFFKTLILNIKVFKDFLNNFNPNIIHLIPSSFDAIYFILFFIKKRKLINIDIRDFSLIEYSQSKRFFLSFFINYYQKFIFNLYLKKINNYKKIKIITLSNFMKYQLIEAGYSEDKIIVIPNISEPIKFKQIKRENKIVFAGRVEEEKGIWDAIKAFEIMDNKNLIFEILGKGTEYENIKSYLEERNIKNIKLLGKVSNEEVLKHYLGSKAIIAPSVWPEPFGRFIQEGISTRTPVIATRVGGIPEGIKDHKTGLLIEPNNPKQLAKAIKELLTDKKLYNKIVKNLEKEADKYSPETIGKQRMKVYEELTRESKSQN